MSAEEVPTSLESGQKFTWESDESATRKGWKMCFQNQPVSTSALFDFHGDCDAFGDCVSSVNFGTKYGNHDKCEVTIKQDVRIIPDPTFELESVNGHGEATDQLKIQDKFVMSAEEVPTSLESGQKFTWESDESATRKGWKMCFQNQPVSTSDYFDFTGDCDSDGDCVSSVNFGRGYGNHDSCTVEIKKDAKLTTDSNFEVESPSDKLNIRGTDYSNPDDVPTTLNAGEAFTWRSDQSATKIGWKICFSARD